MVSARDRDVVMAHSKGFALNLHAAPIQIKVKIRKQKSKREKTALANLSLSTRLSVYSPFVLIEC